MITWNPLAGWARQRRRCAAGAPGGEPDLELPEDLHVWPALSGGTCGLSAGRMASPDSASKM